jgi:hypothetical protein
VAIGSSCAIKRQILFTKCNALNRRECQNTISDDVYIKMTNSLFLSCVLLPPKCIVCYLSKRAIPWELLSIPPSLKHQSKLMSESGTTSYPFSLSVVIIIFKSSSN